MIKRSKKIAEQKEIIKWGLIINNINVSEPKVIKKEDFIKTLPKNCKVKVFDNQFFAVDDVIKEEGFFGDNKPEYIIKDFKEDGTPIVVQILGNSKYGELEEWKKDTILNVGRMKENYLKND